MKNITLDFDGTIAKTTHYHKNGWTETLAELGIDLSLAEVLPYEKNLMERFDSYRRLRLGFFRSKKLSNKIRAYYNSDDSEEELIKRIMDMKESFTISAILAEDPKITIKNLATNLLTTISKIRASDCTIGILSSSRRTIVSALLQKLGLIDYMDYIIGEEDLYKNGLLLDKPHKYGGKVIIRHAKRGTDLYVGDSKIDEVFATNIGCKFLKMDNESNFWILSKYYESS